MDICLPIRYLVLSLVLLANGCSGGSSQTPSQTNSPVLAGKVFALMDVGDSTTILNDFAARTTVDGLAFRTAWRVLEPQDGVYDWTVLDTAFDSVRVRGKQLTLHVGASSLGLPSWLHPLVTTYTYTAPTGGLVTEPIPWDSTFIARYTRFVAALGAHIQARGDMGLLYAVSDGVPVAEMSIFGCQNGSLTGGTGYDRAAYLGAWQTTVTAYAAAFPNSRLLISAPVSVICMPDNDGRPFYTELMDFALTQSSKASVFAADLKATGSARLAQVDTSIRSRSAITFQMIWSATPDPTRMGGSLRDAVCQGLASGGRYFEIYKTDISNTDTAIQDAIQRARVGQVC